MRVHDHTVFIRENGVWRHLKIEGALQILKDESVDLMITDLRLDSEDGFTLIGHTKKHHPETSVLVMTGYATPDTAVQGTPLPLVESTGSAAAAITASAASTSSTEPSCGSSSKRRLCVQARTSGETEKASPAG